MEKFFLPLALFVVLCLSAALAWREWPANMQPTLAICLGVIVAVIAIWHTHNVAVRNIRHARQLERQKESLAFLRAYNANPRVPVASSLIRGGKKYDDLTDEEKRIVKHLLNHFEILAVGLASGIYDREMIKSAFGFDLKRIYKKAEPYIAAIRKEDDDDDDESYAEFQKLAESVSKKMGFSNRGK